VEISPDPPCPDTALCGGYFTGRLAGDGLEIDLGTTPVVQYRYEAAP
jgi:hypothetical protein